MSEGLLVAVGHVKAAVPVSVRPTRSALRPVRSSGRPVDHHRCSKAPVQQQVV